MKKITFYLLSAMLVLAWSCNKDDDSVEENNPPEDFTLTEDNFSVMYNSDNGTVSVDWPDVSDPDGDNVTYELQVDDVSVADDLTTSLTTISANEFSDLSASYNFEVIASDPAGLNSSSSYTTTIVSNASPTEVQTVNAEATFYGAALSWDAVTDPDGDDVFYALLNNGTVIAAGIEGTNYIVRGFNPETEVELSLIATDEYGAESDPTAVTFTTLTKQTIDDETITASVWGAVVNESGDPIEGATVTVANNTLTTNEYGLFQLHDVAMAQDRELLTVTHDGYFKAFKTLKSIAGEISFQKIELLPKEVIGTISAVDGGSVTSSNGLTLELPKNAIDNYNGEVKVAYSFMDASNEDFGIQSPGLESYSAEGEYGALQSFSMTAIELQDANGNELQLSAGKQAEITFPVPSDLQATAPETIPLWSFDEEQNIWVEEGEATLQNGVYVGKVGHFSLWNCDDFRQGRNVCFTVVDEEEMPIGNAYVEIILENGMVASGFTNEDGEICTFMPTGVQYSMNVSIVSSFGFGGGSNHCNLIVGQESEDGGIAFGTTRISKIVSAQGGMELGVSVEGSVTDCDGNLLPNSLVVVRDNQDFAILSGFTNENGEFLLQGRHCFGVTDPNSNTIEVIAYDMANNKYSTPREFTVLGNRIIEEDPFVACEDNIPDFGTSGGETYEGSITLSTDTQIADFALNGYTAINGNLTITSSNVTQAGSLFSILSNITGDLKITNTALTDLDLSGLTSVGDLLAVNGNSSLTELDLSNLTYIGRFIQIRENDALTSVDLSNITELPVDSGAIQFFTNGSLTEINLGSLETTENLTIYDNDALETLNLSSLTSIEYAFTYTQNGNTISELDLSSLTSVGRAFTVTYNTNLTSIDISNLTSLGDGDTSAYYLFNLGSNADLLSINYNPNINFSSSYGFIFSSTPKLETDLVFNNITEIGYFNMSGNRDDASRAINIEFPNVTTITAGGIDLANASNVGNVSFPSLSSIDETVYLQGIEGELTMGNLETVGAFSMYHCDGITTANLPALTTVGGGFRLNRHFLG